MTHSLRLLAKLLGCAGTPVPLANVLLDLARFAESIARDTRCSIVLVDPHSNTLRLAAAPGHDRESQARCDLQSLSEGFGLCAAAVSNRAMAVVAPDDPRSFALCRRTGSGELLGGCSSAPFCDEFGSVAGAVSMYPRSADSARVHADELRLVAQLAGLIVIRHREAERIRSDATVARRLGEREHGSAPLQGTGLLARHVATAAAQLAGIAGRLHPSDAGLAAALRQVEARLATYAVTLSGFDGKTPSGAPGSMRVS